ncbi:darcynin family protein [Actinokineospora inagensis]
MPTDPTPVTAFILVKTTPEWLAMTIADRVDPVATLAT